MGCGWPGQDQTSVEALLPEHTGTGEKKKKRCIWVQGGFQYLAV